MTAMQKDPDALPQLIGEFRPIDKWQAHINRIFYGLRGGRLREFYLAVVALLIDRVAAAAVDEHAVL